MKDRNYTHSIQIDTTKCIGCSHCMQICSTQAIRIVDGHATIMPERCIDCGECFRVCPVSAIYAKDDGYEEVRADGFRIALVPSVFIGHFSSDYTASEVLDVVKNTGFDEVFEVEHAVDLLKEEYQRQAEIASPMRKPLISSFCPAVVRLIQVQYPSFTDNILLVKAPHDITAIYLRKFYEDKGIDPKDIFIYYVTPCAAKVVAAKAPVGEKHSPINGVINMKEVYNRVAKILHDKKELTLSKQQADMSPDSVNWTLSGTEKNYFQGRSLAIDGIENVIEFMERLEIGQISSVDFLEMRSCDQGCAGGILCPGNRFLIVERLGQRQKKLSGLVEVNKSYRNPLMEYADKLRGELGVDPVYPRDGLLLDENMDLALMKTDRIKRLSGYLPGFDCGACGAPSCKSLAEDIVKNKASISHCVFVQRIMEKNYKLSPEQAFQVIEKVWGKNRLNKYNNSDGRANS